MVRESTSDGKEETVEEVDGPDVLPNFSATLMEDLYGCVQVLFMIFCFSQVQGREYS